MGRAGQEPDIRFYWGVSPRDTKPTMSPASNTPGAPLPSVAILGSDALLAARPATPVQLAHACQAAGYAAVYPVTWGDELLAAACTRRVAARGDEPAIFCACPHVNDALLEVGSDLARFLVPLVAPPVACARYLRALYGYNRVRITYIGACPGAHDPAIDARLTPMQFLGVLTQLDIKLQELPEVFDSVIPPDRRRHRSIPGGTPTPEVLASDGAGRRLEEVIDDDWKTELAQRLLLRERALFDPAPSLGCHCAGARPGVSPAAARPSVVALEPPRASGDVVDLNVAVDVDRTVPVIAPRSREIPSIAIAMESPPDERRSEPPPAPVLTPSLPVELPSPAAASVSPTPPDPIIVAEEEARRRKAAAPVVARAAQTVPLARTEGGQVLPRAYAARRRTPPDGAGTVAVAPPPVAAEPREDDGYVDSVPAEEPALLEEAAASTSIEPGPAIATAVPAVVIEPEPVAILPQEIEPEPITILPQEQTAASARPTPRSVTVPIPSEELRPVPPPPAADHARAAIATAAATVALALVVFVLFGTDDGRVTSESSGIAAPVPATLDSLPPLTFPLPDTGPATPNVTAETTATSQAMSLPDSTSHRTSARVAGMPAPRSSRPPPARTRKRLPPIRRSPADSSAAAREASRRAADSIEREAIRRELLHRRARLDSIAGSLEPPPVPSRR